VTAEFGRGNFDYCEQSPARRYPRREEDQHHHFLRHHWSGGHGPFLRLVQELVGSGEQGTIIYYCTVTKTFL